MYYKLKIAIPFHLPPISEILHSIEVNIGLLKQEKKNLWLNIHIRQDSRHRFLPHKIVFSLHRFNS